MNFNDALSIPLTIKAPEFEKLANFKLSENIDGWDKEIIGHIHADLPYVTNHSYEINFKKIDKKYGYAVGAIKFRDLPNIFIPIIIKKYQLSPLDIMITSEKSLPLDQETFDSVVSVKSELGTLRDPNQEQPYLERQDAQANEFATIHPSTKYAFLTKATGNKDVLLKIAQNNKNYLQHYDANKTMDILKNAMAVSKPELVKVANTNIGKDISKVSVRPYDAIEKTGIYSVATMDGKFNDGLFIKDVYDFDLEKQAYSLFINNDYYGFQDKYSGIHKSGFDKTASFKEPMAGDHVTFIAKRGSACMATIPFKLSEKFVVDGHVKMAGSTMLGEPLTIYMTPGLKTITKVGNAYHIPEHKMEAVKLGSFKKFHWNADVIEKMAMAKYSGGNTTRIVRDNGMYSVQNDRIKTAGLHTSEELYEVLAPHYSNAAEMIKLASEKKAVLFTGVSNTETSIKPFSLGVDIENMFKIASGLSEPDSVDAVLSLGYINESNVKEYVDMIPDFEDVITKLAKLLLAIRTGLRGDEYCTKQAMSHLQQAVNKLKSFIQ